MYEQNAVIPVFVANICLTMNQSPLRKVGHKMDDLPMTMKNLNKLRDRIENALFPLTECSYQ